MNIIQDHVNYFDVFSQVNIETPTYEICNISVVLQNGLVFSPKGMHLNSLLYNSRSTEKGFRTRVLKFFIKSFLTLQFRYIKNNTKVTSVINEWSNNYFHWFTEVLPRLYYLKEKITKIEILLPEEYISEYQLASLNILGVGIRRFKKLAFVKKLILPARQAPYSAHYNPYFIIRLSKYFINYSNPNINLGEKIYITRKNCKHRKIVNENEVEIVLKKYGFTVLDYAQFSLVEQISITNHAKIIMGIHGAGLTNMMFLNPGNYVYEFSLENQYLDKCYYTLANALDLKYYYQFCKSIEVDANYLNSDLFVDIKTLTLNLQTILNERP